MAKDVLCLGLDILLSHICCKGGSDMIKMEYVILEKSHKTTVWPPIPDF